MQAGTESRYVTIGYLSVYNYYAFPDKKRSRISQVLIFPNYQHAGHGAELVEAIYRDACRSENIVDVTAEDPSPEFINLRDFVTTKMCMQLDSFKDKANLKKCFSAQMAQEALKTFKLPKLQSRRCYEILRLAATNQSQHDEWRDFRLDIKKRFYLPFIRKSKFARNGKSGNSSEGNETSEQSKTSGTSSSSSEAIGKRNLEDRFGPSESKRFKRDDVGVTTIGFGNNAVPVSTTPLSFSSKLTPATNGKKVVSFSTVSINTSNSTTDNSHNDDDDENEDEDKNDQEGGVEKLFLSEQERKEYLDKEFQQALVDYKKILKRLENAKILV